MSLSPSVLGRLLAVGVSIGAIAGCNMITGADQLVLLQEDDDDGSGGGGASGPSNSGSGATSASGGSGGESSSSTGDPLPAMASVEGVTISDIILYQGVARPLMQNGNPASSNVPIVAQRGALVRIFYDTNGYNGEPVTARLTIGETVLDQVVTLGGTSNNGALDSTINFEVPPPAINGNASYRVDLMQPLEQVTGDNPAARFPTDEALFESLPTEQSGVLKITLVPVQYNADGSGRLPDTSAGQLDKYTDLFFSMYPVEDVQITVRSQPMPWNSTISPNGNGWSNLLNSVADLRLSDNVPSETYYYGIMEPASSQGAFCGGGCVSGLGFVGGPGDAYTRAAIGLGFSGDMSVNTAVHELGHNHGRDHAPCGTSGDPNYPHGGASIGVWGYDLLTGQLFNPAQFVDMMSYCDPPWISDYNFTAIFNRVKTVSAADIYVPPALQNLSYERLFIDEDGNLSWLDPIVLRVPPQGAATNVTVQTTSGEEQITAQFVGYDHVDGGVLFVPPTVQPMTPSKAVTGWIQGKLIASGTL